MKNLENMNQPQLEIMKKYNEIISKKSVIFHSKVWCNRNELFHDESRYELFIIDWYHRIAELVQISNKPQMKKYIESKILMLIDVKVV